MTGCLVCGVDESSGSRRAASMAARLARDLCSRALLVHVTDARAVPFGLRLPRPARTRAARKMLRAVFAEHCFPRATDLRVEIGDPADRLIALAEEKDAELIVVGSRGRGEIRAELLGSVSSALMNRAPCPVVVMPRAAVAPLDAVSIRSVVCGIAGEEGDASLLRLAEDLARRLGGDLHVVHAYDPRARHVAPAGGPAAPVDVDLRRSAELRLATALRNTEVEAHGVVLSLRAAEALDRVAEEKRAGLVVVGSQGRSKLGSVLHGSVPTRLAAEGSTAVVVLPPAARLEPGSGHYECAAQAV